MLNILLLLPIIGSPHILTAGAEAALLSEGRSTPVVVAKELKDQFVYVEPNGAGFEAQLAATALALHASILHVDGKLRIERTDADRERLHRRRTAMREKWITTLLDDIADHRKRVLAKQSIADAFLSEVERRSDAMQALRAGKAGAQDLDGFGAVYLLPSAAYADALLRRIGVAALGALPTGQVTVFEDNPVAGALPLPNHEDLAADYVTKQSQFALPDLTPAVRRKMMDLGYDKLGALDAGSAAPSKIRVRVAPGVSAITMSTEAFDLQGRRLFAVNFTVSAIGTILSDRDILSRFREDASKLSPVLHDESISAVKFAHDRVGSLPAWLLHPDRSEPLDLFVRDAVTSLGGFESQNKCFAMCVSDGMWRRVLACIVHNRVNLDALKLQLESWLPYERIQAGAVTVMRPEDPEGDESTRTNRKVLAKFAQAAALQPSARAAASLFHDSSQRVGALDSTWLVLAQNPHGIVLGGDVSPQFNRLLGAISDSDWEMLVQRGRMTVGQLGITDELNAFLREESAIRLRSNSPLQAVFAYVPELVPKGAGDDTVIEVRNLDKRLIKWFQTGQPTPDVGSEYQGLALFLCPAAAVIPGPDGPPIFGLDREQAENRIKDLRFTVGSRTDLEISIHVTPDTAILASLRGQEGNYGAPFSYSDLSQAERDQMWEEGQRQAVQYAIAHPPVDLGQLKKSLAAGGSSNKVPPP